MFSNYFEHIPPPPPGAAAGGAWGIFWKSFENISLLIGRIIIGLYFLGLGAVAKIFNYDYVYKYMLEHEVPFTHIALVLTIIIQFICSIHSLRRPWEIPAPAEDGRSRLEDE